jgi:hypothetical protein
MQLLNKQNEFIENFTATTIYGIVPSFWEINLPFHQYGPSIEILDITHPDNTQPTLKLIQAYEPTTESDTKGRFRIIHHRDNTSAVQDFLTTTFQQWYKAAVEEQLIDNPDRFMPEFSTPTIMRHQDQHNKQANHFQDIAALSLGTTTDSMSNHSQQHDTHRKKPYKRPQRPTMIYVSPNKLNQTLAENHLTPGNLRKPGPRSNSHPSNRCKRTTISS